MNTLFWGGLAIGILLGSGLRALLVPITPDGRTERRIQEEAYIHGYNDGIDGKHGAYALMYPYSREGKLE